MATDDLIERLKKHGATYPFTRDGASMTTVAQELWPETVALVEAAKSPSEDWLQVALEAWEAKAKELTGE